MACDHQFIYTEYSNSLLEDIWHSDTYLNGCWMLQVYISYFFYKWTRIVLYLETLGLALSGEVQTLIGPVQLLSKPAQWQDC